MNLLLDTHVLLWWLDDNPTISGEALKAISAGDNNVFVSAVALWEIAIKTALGKLETLDHAVIIEEAIANDFRELTVSIRHTQALTKLPFHHNDPFDRMLIAQAIVEGLTIVTCDKRIMKYGIPHIKA